MKKIMRALLIRAKDIKDLVIFRDNDHYVLRVHIYDVGHYDIDRVPCENEALCKSLKGTYDLVKDAMKQNNAGGYVEFFSMED